MGLTIHYTLSVKRGTTVGWLKSLLRRTQRLADKLGCAEDHDRLIAGLGGLLKDANGGGEVVEPIFNYRNFEQLEHEGRQSLRERRPA
jgi:hypothetical protein